MFSFLSSENQKTVVGFSLTPGVGLEAVVLDKSKTQVLKYGRKRVDYNFSQRNIQDYTQFKSALTELIGELQIAPKTYAYLVLPNVFFDFIELSKSTSEDGVEMALISTAEEFYIFKKDEPVIGWCDVGNPIDNTQTRYAYTAFQKTDIDEIRAIFADLGLQLAGIETSYSATIRGINLTGMISDAVLMNTPWTALVINSNSFTLFQMEGKHLIDCNDVPLAIKSFSPEEAYQAIVSSVSQLLANYNSNQLYIISQTDDISADALKKIMQYDRDVIAIESNRYSKKSLLEITGAVSNFDEANSMTLAALGSADNKSDFGLTLNVLEKDPNASMGVYFTTNFLGKQIEVTSSVVQGIAVTLTFLFAVIFGVAIGFCIAWDNSQQSKLRDLDSELKRLETQIQQLSKVEVKEEEIDMTDVIDAVAQSNVTTINFYDSISSDIPKNIWLTKYYNKAGDKLVVRGIAESIVDIYEYYKNLKIISPQSDIKLTELKVIANPDGGSDASISSLIMDRDVDRLYSFEISNTSVQLDMSIYTNRGGGGEYNMGGMGMPKSSIDESDLLKGPPQINIEQPSDQMSPAY